MLKRYQKATNPKPTIIIDSCEKLTLWRYMQIIDSNDLKWLVRSGDVPNDEVLQKAFDKIMTEFNELKGNEKQKQDFDKITYIEELRLTIQTVYMLLKTLEQSIFDQLIDEPLLNKYLLELKKWGFPLNKDAVIRDEIQRIASELQALQSTVSVLISEVYPEDDENEQKDKNQNKKLLFLDMLLNYQRILEIDRIDVKKTSLMELVVIEKQALEKIEHQRKLLNRK